MSERALNRPLSAWLLVIAMLTLAIGGLAGAYGFLSDPSGEGMGMAAQLALLPVPDYTLPGIFLLVVMCFLPLVIVYGLVARPMWQWLDPLVHRSGAHWAWAASVLVAIVLAGWLAIQVPLIGFTAPMQWFTAGLDLTILASAFAPATRAFYRVAT